MMLRHEYEYEKKPTQPRVDHHHLHATPRLDGWGGVDVAVDVPAEPPIDDRHRTLGEPGEQATIKIWTQAQQGPTPVRPIGAPSAVRSEPTPIHLDMPGAGYDPKQPPRYYGVTVQIVIGYEVVDTYQQSFEILDGQLRPAPFLS